MISSHESSEHDDNTMTVPTSLSFPFLSAQKYITHASGRLVMYSCFYEQWIFLSKPSFEKICVYLLSVKAGKDKHSSSWNYGILNFIMAVRILTSMKPKLPSVSWECSGFIDIQQNERSTKTGRVTWIVSLRHSVVSRKGKLKALAVTAVSLTHACFSQCNKNRRLSGLIWNRCLQIYSSFNNVSRIILQWKFLQLQQFPWIGHFTLFTV